MATEASTARTAWTTECVGRIEWIGLPAFLLQWRLTEYGSLEFRAFCVTGDLSDDAGINLNLEAWRADGCNQHVDTRAVDLDTVIPGLSGAIKWDGCSNIGGSPMFDHFCEAEDVRKRAALLLRCYELAAENIESWNA